MTTFLTVPKPGPKQEALFLLDHKDAYRQIRNYLAGRLLGATRDEIILQEVVKCLFCKLYLQRADRNSITEDPSAIAVVYDQAYKELTSRLPDIFPRNDQFLLDTESLAYVDRMLDGVDVDQPTRDPIGDLYEAFIGTTVRGQEGQFFTPKNAVSLLVAAVDPRIGETIIDPACGAGGFLSAAATHLLAQGAAAEQVASQIYGVDKDRYLVGLARAHLSLKTLERANVFCADSLAWAAENGTDFPLRDKIGQFDIVLTNPPFGAKIVAASRETQRGFRLGHRWVLDRRTRQLAPSSELQPSVPPQVLFVERCLSLLRPGGRLGIIVPESLLSGSNYRYVVQYIRHQARVQAVLGMPESLFKTSGKGGTHTKACLLLLEKKSEAEPSDQGRRIFMAEAQWCGHDSRGRPIRLDDLPTIAANYRAFREGALRSADALGYSVPIEELVDDILAPRYYSPDVAAELARLAETHELVRFGDLVASGLVTISSGDEVGKLAYGTGNIPFVRTSDISNWEVKLDPKHGVSEEIYQSLARKQDVSESDILMVRDGTYLIGTCAFITKYDTRIVFQSHIYKLRVTDHSQLSPYLLLAALSSGPVQRQIKAKRFTQDIIDSLGSRVHELILPLPKDPERRRRVTAMVEKAIQERIEARELARRACIELIGEAQSGAESPDL
ncbi:MAG TPA: N-6 DNA methylase [Chloroflexota bacterium]|nr:N-6 DNA methylase [Chloroflexota bacterium]